MYWRGSAEYLMDLFSEITDRMTIKLFGVVEGDMAADGLGAPPADYCWLSLAEAGRREQVPPLYQNHALIYSQAGSEPDDRFQNWFLEFARRVTAGLARWGRQPSPSGLMASDPRWLRSTLTWRRLALEWAADADPNHPPAGWFDFRPVTGEPGYIHHLKRDMLEAAAASDRPTALFRAGWSQPPPIGFLRQAVVENDGTYAPTLGLSRPLELIVSGVRALAWRHRIEETNTLARLSRLAAEGLVPGNLAADLRESFSFITLFRIERFIEAQKNNQPYQDQTAPSELSGTKRRRFKDCFAVLADFGRRLETWLKAGPSAHTG
jgi:CBS domain-containing protein